jgi:RNA polymerase sigma-70 factor, ECF subfamily
MATYAIMEPAVAEMTPFPEPVADGESALAARLAERDPEAVREVYERHGPMVFGFLLKTLGNRPTAEDVQQQVFLEVWQRGPTFDPARGSLLTWVMTIARSRAIDQLRRRVPEPVGGSDEPVFERDPDDRVDDVERLIERYRAASLLAQLPNEERRLLRMRFYDDLSQSQIAERTGLPLGTVKMRMARAFVRLRELMEEDE